MSKNKKKYKHLAVGTVISYNTLLHDVELAVVVSFNCCYGYHIITFSGKRLYISSRQIRQIIAENVDDYIAKYEY